MKFLIEKHIPYIAGVLEPFGEVQYFEGVPDAADADVLIVRTRTECSAELLGGSRVQLVATATIGTEHIDMEYCRQRGIEVVSAAGANAAAVLQWVAAVMVELRAKPCKTTLGIVGVGNVGSLVKQYADSWGANVIFNDKLGITNYELGIGNFKSLAEIVEEADIITFHVPLDGSTRGMIDESMARRVAERGAVIINSSRGGIADEEALVRYGTRYCADVWRDEPGINRALLESAIVATPHIAGYSAQGKANATAAAVRAVARKFGLPLTDWYPAEVPSVNRQLISWEELKWSIGEYINVGELTGQLKADPAKFEVMRNSYSLRQEYF